MPTNDLPLVTGTHVMVKHGTRIEEMRLVERSGKHNWQAAFTDPATGGRVITIDERQIVELAS